MIIKSLFTRIASKYRRTISNQLCRRMATIKSSTPLISFTFDDAPWTAFSQGGEILKAYGARATFYVSLGLLGSQTEVGNIANTDHLCRAVEDGNELGCHTFDHLDTWQSPTEKLIESVLKNKQELNRIIPGTHFRTFAYPKSEPKPTTKCQLAKHFICCRGGGQASNVGMADLNLLKAFFLDKRTKCDIGMVKRLIDYNSSSQGWLIFATHDVDDTPSIYGCTRNFFDEVVAYAARSGALILPVTKALEQIKT